MILLDTNILIDYSRGDLKAKNFIEKHGKNNLAISTVVSMELYQGCLNKYEFAKIKKELIGFNSIPLSEEIGDIALK